MYTIHHIYIYTIRHTPYIIKSGNRGWRGGRGTWRTRSSGGRAPSMVRRPCVTARSCPPRPSAARAPCRAEKGQIVFFTCFDVYRTTSDSGERQYKSRN